MDIQKLKVCMYDSYWLLKKEYELKDEDILEMLLELFGEDINNEFIGMLKSSYESNMVFGEKQFDLLNAVNEKCYEEEIYVEFDFLCNIFRIVYLLKFLSTVLHFNSEGSGYRSGNYICGLSSDSDNEL